MLGQNCHKHLDKGGYHLISHQLTPGYSHTLWLKLGIPGLGLHRPKFHGSSFEIVGEKTHLLGFSLSSPGSAPCTAL